MKTNPSSNPTLDNTCRQTGYISKLICNCLIKRMPRKFKRLIFLSSVLAIIEDIKDPTESIIHKLNNLLKLTNTEAALQLPMYMHSFIWQKSLPIEFNPNETYSDYFKKVFKEHTNNPDYQAISQFFCSHAPRWLIYGSDDLMSRDLNIMFNHLPELVAG